MSFEYDPKTGQWTDTYQDKTQPESLQIGAGVSLKTDKMPAGLSLAEKLDWMENATVEQREAELEERTITGADQAKEKGFGDGWGFLRDVGRGGLNSLEALASDYVDLGLGLTDLAVQGASAAVGKGFDGDAVFNDADNPWTKARRARWKTETQAGQFVSDVFRVGVALLTLPKVGIKGLVTGGKVLTLGKASTNTGVLGALTRLDKAFKGAQSSAKISQAANAVGAAKEVSKAGKGASKLLASSSGELMQYSYKRVSELGEAGNALKDAWRSAEAVASGLAKKKMTFKGLGQALAWDAFVAFNAAGEGDSAFDETFSDMLDSWGMGGIPVLKSSPLQSNWTAKLKQMSEGLLLGSVLEGVFNIAQVARYANAFKRAAPAEQQALLRAFDAEAFDLGSSIGKEYLDSLGVLPYGPTRPAQSQVALSSPSYLKQSLADNPALQQQRADAERFLGGSMPSTQTTSELPMSLLMEGRPLLDDLLEAVETGRIQNDLTTETQRNLREWGLNADIDRRMAEVADRQAAERIDREVIGFFDNEPASAAFNRPERPASVIDPGQAALPGQPPPAGLLADPRIEPVDVQIIRPPTPTVTPQTFRQAWTDYVRSINGLPNYEELLQEGMVKLERLLPPGRVDGIDWMDAMEKDLNEAGVIPATNSLASNMYLQRGLLEGWASIDPETGFAQFNRKLAFDFDKSENIQKEAQKLDDAAELERFNAAPIDTEQAAKLADEELGVSETLRQAQVDDVKAQQFDAQEAAELDAAALEGIGNDPDSVLVAEMLGQRLDQLPSPTIEKLGARKYGLVDEAGEVLEQFSTLKQAKKSLEAEQGRIREAAIARAKRMRDNATDQPQVWTPGGMVGESDVVGKIKFTKTQLKFLEDRGMKLPGTNYELSQSQMSEFAKGLRTLADSGQFVGQQKKMLNNMIDRLDVQVKTLEPMARARRIVDDTVQQAKKFNNNGEFCL